MEPDGVLESFRVRAGASLVLVLGRDGRVLAHGGETSFDPTSLAQHLIDRGALRDITARLEREGRLTLPADGDVFTYVELLTDRVILVVIYRGAQRACLLRSQLTQARPWLASLARDH